MEKTKLSELREKIHHIDLQILTLLAERQNLSIGVAHTKKGTNLTIRDKNQEQKLLNSLLKSAKVHHLDHGYITSLFQLIIENSIIKQKSFLKHNCL